MGSPYIRKDSEKSILLEPAVKQIADKYKKTNAQVLIKFQVLLYLILIKNKCINQFVQLRSKEEFWLYRNHLTQKD